MTGLVSQGSSGSSINPLLTGALDGSNNLQPTECNQSIVLFPLASRLMSGAIFTAWQTNNFGRGVTLYLDVTAVSGGASSLTATINAMDPAASGTGSVMTDTPCSGVGFFPIRLYPGLTGAGSHNQGNAMLPTMWQVKISPGENSGNNYTFGLGASVIV